MTVYHVGIHPIEVCRGIEPIVLRLELTRRAICLTCASFRQPEKQ